MVRASLRRLLLSAVLACSTAPVLAGAPNRPDAEPDGLEIGGSFRMFAEAIDGQFRPGRAEDDAILLLRTSLLASYTTGPVQVVGELVDARAYGQDLDTPISTSNVNALEPLQAYAALDLGQLVHAPFGGSVKAGRFTMHMGASRLVARAGFINYPHSFTGAQIDLAARDSSRLRLFWTMPNIRLPGDIEDLQHNEVELDRSTTDLEFYGAHYARPLLNTAQGEIYLYRLTEEDAPGYRTRNRNLLTYGVRFHQAPVVNAFDYDIEYALQGGEVRASSASADLRELDVDASFFHADVGRTFADGWKTRISAHFDFASGDGPGAEYSRFDPLFGARRGDLGPTSLFGPVTRSNLVSGGVRLEAKLSDRLDAMTMYRALWLDEPTDKFALTGVRDATGNSGTWAGNQIELRLRYWVVPSRLRLEASGAYLDKGRFLRDAPNAPATGNTRHGYLSLTTSF
ncbi:alginate export family protein [Altericroceibacterium xinjiangense]|uniref:alginate export family protein n=1 Tax=Altericroceibacterium xinjiangense TaxID=762261 RepID=UPI0013E042C1|nr:alginate export family protein [Altericroceibacterium xinjiangense]